MVSTNKDELKLKIDALERLLSKTELNKYSVKNKIFKIRKQLKQLFGEGG